VVAVSEAAPGRERTRARIVDAARRLFAERGYAGASIRAIAAEASVDPALVHHYCGSKEDLFREALAFPVDPARIAASVMADGVEAAPERFVRTFLELWDSPETQPALLSFLRRAIAEPENAELLRDFVGSRLLAVVAGTVLADVEPAEAQARIAFTMSQLLGLALTRHVLRIGPLVAMSVDELVVAVSPTIARYLTGDLSQPCPVPDQTRSDDHS